jgi:hypothetical protein
MTEEHKNNLACQNGNATKVSCPYCNKILLTYKHETNAASIIVSQSQACIVDTEKS